MVDKETKSNEENDGDGESETWQGVSQPTAGVHADDLAPYRSPAGSRCHSVGLTAPPSGIRPSADSDYEIRLP